MHLIVDISNILNNYANTFESSVLFLQIMKCVVFMLTVMDKPHRAVESKDDEIFVV